MNYNDITINYHIREITNNEFVFSAFLIKNNQQIGKCIISDDNSIWTISGWYINKEYQHMGYGKKLMQFSVLTFYKEHCPYEIQYIWNGTNEYVFNWMQKHYSPISLCPLNVQKNCFDDDWSSHIYKLNKNKFLADFNSKEVLERE